MAQLTKIEVQLEIKSSAESFYEVFRSKQHLFPIICPDLVKSIKVIKGDWESVGSIKEWDYVAGNAETAKEMVEEIDEKNKAISLKVLDGEATKYYKNMKFTLQVRGMEQGGSSVKWTLEYEKLNKDIPAPTKYSEAFQVLARNVDAFLSKYA
ncbi:Major latex protein domain containing protein [Trema orientale]|uniref:Major latex protein domain containing protein n=1 Tax=Trema orientale TaxID=63057 RepID=A0A2P5DLL0_TREOI|nr:Major latex protein domain containing protein [Trema orientale]